MAITITLSLVSHTNVGKTTLARTLLGADVGEIRDAPHVTEFADGHELIESPEGHRLRLWDTPGFGDSARLARRLMASGNPLGWFMSEVWDRWRDRGFWASQQAMRHVQAESDVVLYLVNAAESPAAAGYVAPEMDLLAWVGKPVIVLLNQMGEPREPALEAADVQAWRNHLQRWPQVQAVLPLDAFARCWVHEATLLRSVQTSLSGDKASAMARLAAAWAARNQQRFDLAMQELATSLARMAGLREAVAESPGLVGRLARMGSAMSASLGGGAQGMGTVQQPEEAAAQDIAKDMAAATPAETALYRALASEVQASTDRLLAQHSLTGRARENFLRRVSGQFTQRQRVPEGRSALLGGAVAGAATGLKADIASGGFTLGGGLLVGALLGALGGGGVARVLNVVRGTDRSWLLVTPEALDQYLKEAVLRYLAVAHFGRGRGEWVQGEAPPHWPGTVEQALAPQRAAVAALWGARDPKAPAPDPQPLAAQLQPLLAATVRGTLDRLYPAATHNPAP
jgi:hypothetical protein